MSTSNQTASRGPRLTVGERGFPVFHLDFPDEKKTKRKGDHTDNFVQLRALQTIINFSKKGRTRPKSWGKGREKVLRSAAKKVGTLSPLTKH